MNKKCVKKCISSPGITVRVGQCEFRYNIVNFHKKRSVPKEIPSEVEVSVVKMILITRDYCRPFDILSMEWHFICHLTVYNWAMPQQSKLLLPRYHALA